MTVEKQSWQLDKRPRRRRFGRAVPRATATSAVSRFRIKYRITDRKRGRSEVKRKSKAHLAYVKQTICSAAIFGVPLARLLTMAAPYSASETWSQDDGWE